MTKYVPLESKEYPGWYEIPGYSKYLANRKGEIFTKKTRNFTAGGNAGRYLKVSVYADGAETPSLRYVHDLVCRAFYGAPTGNFVVLHDDNNRKNNLPTNLSWGTQAQNVKDAWMDGLRGLRVSKENLPVSLMW